MSVEVAPLGVRCNLSCTYCYQHPMRDAGNYGTEKPYDMQKMLRALEEENSDFSVFGGEALLVPIEDLKILFEYGYKKWKKNGVQSNGVLITQEHIELFRQYNVHVGLSLDGPDEMNDSRWAGSHEKTREATAKSFANMKAMIAAGVGTSVIITLYKGNATAALLPRLKAWIKELDVMGSRGVRIHLLEVDHPAVKAKMQLTEDETIRAVKELVELDKTLTKSQNFGEHATREAALAEMSTLRGKYPRLSVFDRGDKGDPKRRYVVHSQGLELDILTDMRKLLRADDNSVTCIWNPCDPYTTSAVRGIDGQGNKSNCGRTNKDGVLRVKGTQAGHERQIALYNTPHEAGGCKGCRFFVMCKGQCPGTAINGDWRNRSSDCKVWFTLFEMLEQEMLSKGEQPLSLDYEMRTKVEEAMLPAWARGQHLSIKNAVAQIKRGGNTNGATRVGDDHGDAPHGDDHGDHTDYAAAGLAEPALGAPHNDADHGDDHGDHTDEALLR